MICDICGTQYNDDLFKMGGLSVCPDCVEEHHHNMMRCAHHDKQSIITSLKHYVRKSEELAQQNKQLLQHINAH